MIGRFFRRDTPEALPEERGPLGLIIGGALEIDTLRLQADMATGEPAMGAPEGGPFIVAAVGQAMLDADTMLTRYYDEDHRLLQVLAPPGAGMEAVNDVSLYLALGFRRADGRRRMAALDRRRRPSRPAGLRRRRHPLSSATGARGRARSTSWSSPRT